MENKMKMEKKVIMGLLLALSMNKTITKGEGMGSYDSYDPAEIKRMEKIKAAGLKYDETHAAQERAAYRSSAAEREDQARLRHDPQLQADYKAYVASVNQYNNRFGQQMSANAAAVTKAQKALHKDPSNKKLQRDLDFAKERQQGYLMDIQDTPMRPVHSFEAWKKRREFML